MLQLYLRGLGHCILPDGGVVLPVASQIVDGQSVALIDPIAAGLYISGGYIHPELTIASTYKELSDKDFFSRGQQIDAGVMAPHKYFLDIHLDPALVSPDLYLGIACIFALYASFVCINI